MRLWWRRAESVWNIWDGKKKCRGGYNRKWGNREENNFKGSNMSYFESTGDEEIGGLIMQLKNKFIINFNILTLMLPSCGQIDLIDVFEKKRIDEF